MRRFSGFQDLRCGAVVVCHYAMGISFLALILFVEKLYDVDRQNSFLQTVTSVWIPDELPVTKLNTSNQEASVSQPSKVPSSGDQQLSSSQLNLSNLKADLEYNILELQSVRTTLILSIVFTLEFILSWWWMAFSISQTTQEGGVPLKIVFFLGIFAAVDIVASIGFILVRIVMSSCGTNDVFVAIVIGFLTGLRLYTVFCTFFYYKITKQGDVKPITTSSYSENQQRFDGLGTTRKQRRLDVGQSSLGHMSDIYDYIPRPKLEVNTTTFQKDIRPLDIYRSTNTLRSNGRKLSSVTATTSTDDEPAGYTTIEAGDMPKYMQRIAIESLDQAVRVSTSEKHIAECIKQKFDSVYGPTWHCIVGRNWNSAMNHSKQCYVKLANRDFKLLLYKSTS
ncbi:uncharacterized protein LOC143228737 isoform X2 [Tachypleus tridentatus]|uniref:uncharacterized protein LOC143228737 isoform X2 n=1 Tax=Tachypleus tridentatus TaxID=6853 RepID=UPI003FCF53B1